MEKESRNLNFRVTPWIIFFLLLPLLYLHVFFLQHTPLHHFTTTTRIIRINENTHQKQQNSLDFLLTKLVKGEQELAELKSKGFVCNASAYSKHCVSRLPVRLDTSTMTVHIPSSLSNETVIRPYARQEDPTLLKTVTPVRILQGGGGENTPPPPCHRRHVIPAVVFSTAGFAGNVFHEMNEVVIPLYITTRRFKSNVLLVMEDYRPSFVRKYGKILARLSAHEVVDPAKARNSSAVVHCFPGAVIGLEFHGHLAVGPGGDDDDVSMKDFKRVLRESLGLRHSHVSTVVAGRRPTAMVLSRRTTRRFLNEEEMVAVMEEVGFRVVVVGRAGVVSDLGVFAGMVNECSVFVGAHGAGLTNELFLAEGAVMVQVDLIGLEWAAEAYYGGPARGMGVRYLRYRVEPEESSLLKVFYGQRNHTYMTDTKALPDEAGREVYLNGQNVRVNLTRFRETMVEAMSLVTDSDDDV